MRSVVLVVGLMACKEDPGTSVYEPANLERATVSIEDQEDFEGVRRDWVGELRIDGDGPDYTVVVATSAGNEEIDVHSSGRSDLTGLDGLAGAQVSVAPEPISDEMSLSIVDAAGELLYLLEPVEAGILTVDHFGQGLVAVGEDLGEITVESFDVAFTSAFFRTDTGDVDRRRWCSTAPRSGWS